MMRLSNLLKLVPLALCRRIGDGGDVDPIIQRVVEDSRTVRAGDLFVARPGVKNNGQQFIAEAIAHGAVAVVTDEPHIVPTAAHVAVLQCVQPAPALGFLAQAIHEFPARDMKLLAITGTNGKTTITYLLRNILRRAGISCGLLGTVQVDDGHAVMDSSMTTPGPVELAALLARMREHGVRAVALEASSHALSQDRLAGLNIQVAMFSNLTGDHLDYHGSMENYAAAKARLFASLAPEAWAIVNAQDAWSSRMIRDCRAQIWSYGIDGPADFSGTIHAMDSTGMELTIRGPEGMILRVRTGLLGRYNMQNILCAAAASRAAGVESKYIAAGLRSGDLVPGRLQPVVPAGVKREKMPFTVLVDYAHTHDALENVLTAIRGFTTGKIICLFGCGGDRDTTKRPKMAAVAQRLADKIIVTDDNPRTEKSADIIAQIRRGFTGNVADRLTILPDRATAIGYAIAHAEKGDVVLIAGKGHEHYQIIGASRYHFDDVEKAQEALQARLGLTTNGAP